MKKILLPIAAGLFAFASSILAASPADYVVHEWGTFTSVQGADGVQMDWNPFITEELPKFVYDRSKLAPPARGILVTKAKARSKQRLETPVIYFHANEPLSVDVSVRFPQGSVTEWYPRAEIPQPARPGSPAIVWKGVAITPRSGEKPGAPLLLREVAGSHYYTAREAEADVLHMPADDQGVREVEKFLFYRGVGDFVAPLTVSQPDPERARISLRNTGTEMLRDLFLVEVRAGKMAVTEIAQVGPGRTIVATIGQAQPLDAAREHLASSLRSALSRAGLFPSEAAAMVKTWDDSWFIESGVRLLYLLPTKWADQVLPLTLTPAPRKVVRVFVGRAEVITPQMERTLHTAVANFSSDREGAVAQVRALGLGRFLEPAFRRLVLQNPKDRKLSTVGWELLAEASCPVSSPTISAR